MQLLAVTVIEALNTAPCPHALQVRECMLLQSLHLRKLQHSSLHTGAHLVQPHLGAIGAVQQQIHDLSQLGVALPSKAGSQQFAKS